MTLISNLTLDLIDRFKTKVKRERQECPSYPGKIKNRGRVARVHAESFYSVRRVAEGSILVIRNVGRKLAAAAMTARMTGTIARVSGS